MAGNCSVKSGQLFSNSLKAELLHDFFSGGTTETGAESRIFQKSNGRVCQLTGVVYRNNQAIYAIFNDHPISRDIRYHTGKAVTLSFQKRIGDSFNSRW